MTLLLKLAFVISVPIEKVSPILPGLEVMVGGFGFLELD